MQLTLTRVLLTLTLSYSLNPIALRYRAVLRRRGGAASHCNPHQRAGGGQRWHAPLPDTCQVLLRFRWLKMCLEADTCKVLDVK